MEGGGMLGGGMEEAGPQPDALDGPLSQNVKLRMFLLMMNNNNKKPTNSRGGFSSRSAKIMCKYEHYRT